MLDLIGEHAGHLFANQNRFAVRPLHTVRVGEKSDLFVGRQHVEPLGHDLPNGAGEKIVPPVTGQAEVWEFARQRAE